VVLAAVGALSIAPAQGAFPGRDGRIAYVRFGGGIETNIFSVDKNGGNRRELTGGCCNDLEPSWSPDGKKIAFDRYGDIFVMRDDGTHLKRVAKGRGRFGYTQPAWSPDGRWIAFEENASAIGLVRPNGGGMRTVDYEGDAQSPAWSPDGDRLAFVDTSDDYVIATMNRDGSDVQVVTESPKATNYPDWSPDGQTITFSRESGRSQIHVVPATGGEATQLTDGGKNINPVFAPDGREILYECAAGLCTVPPDGGAADVLVKDRGRETLAQPSWEAR
jgi:TolB protein